MTITRHTISGGLLASVLSATLVLPALPAQAAEVELGARMHDTAAFANARGHAEYDADRDGREFEIGIAGVHKLAGKRVAVRVHGDLIGRMTVGTNGRAHLERHSGVPKMSAGNAVRVRIPSGKLVAYGQLHHQRDN